MTKEEFLIKSKNHEAIYGFMYGVPVFCSDGTFDTDIIDIPIRELEIWDECLCYQWGFPGPDFNLYNYEDYGLSWAFKKEDIDVEAALKKVKDRCQL